ncbi:MAG: beta strand repeat-containing protein, partial [Crocosphaera sp.]
MKDILRVYPYLIGVSVSCWFQSLTLAQVIPDNTLGGESSQITNIDQLRERIDGGAIRGGNLFHSFLEFNVGEGRGVYFSNPAGIENILSRVTGGNASHILGQLGVLGNANLFLLNPNGIIFGQNSSLDIQGSFHASTAEGIKLGEKGFFGAVEPQKSNLLSVDPGVLLFNQAANHSGSIINRGSLAVGGDLNLTAGNLDLQGQLYSGGNLTLKSLNTVKIRDTVTNPFVAAAMGNLLIQGNETVDIFALNHPDSGLFSRKNLALSSAHTVIGDAHYYSGGSFSIEKLDGSLNNLYSPNDPVIRSNGDVFIGAYEGASLHIIAGGSVTIPDFIVITGADPIFGLQENITLANGQEILIDGKNTPTVDIRAGVSPEFIGFPLFQGSDNDQFFGASPPSSISTSADINIGTIVFSRNPNDINQKITGDVLLTNQYKPNLNLQGNITLNPTNPFFGFTAIDTASFGDGGRVILDSRNNIDITGEIFALAFGEFGKGGEVLINSFSDVSINGLIDVVSSQDGNIKINGDNIFITDSSILAGNRPNVGFENAQTGNIYLNATETLDIQNSVIENSVYFNGVGNSGQIIIDAKNLNLSNNSLVFNNVNGIGNSGGIIVNSSDFNITNNSLVVSSVFGRGNSGEITVNTNNLALSNTGRIVSNTLGEGDSGGIKIQAMGDIVINDDSSSILSQVENGGQGNSGGVNIETGTLSLTNGGQIDSSTIGLGNGGAITIQASEGIIIDGESNDGLRSSRISSSVQRDAVGNSGDIEIDTSSLSLTNGGLIFATSFGQGDGGNIKITTTERIFIDGEKADGFASSIRSASSVSQSEDTNLQGNSGNIEIDTSSLSLTNGGLITSSTFKKGDAGTIKIKSRDGIIIQGQTINDPVPSAISSQIESPAEGNSGGIEIETSTLNISDGGAISALTVGKGNSGSINIIATDIIVIDANTNRNFQTGIFSQVESDGIGSSQGIVIDTESLTIKNGGEINASTNGQGNSGKIQIKASKNLSLDGEGFTDTSGFFGSSILSQVQNDGIGNSGGINIETGNLSITNGGEIDSSTFGQGNAGVVNIKASKGIILDGATSDGFVSSRIASTVQDNAVGNSGGIEINTSSLTLTNGGLIFATSVGQGNAGKIGITAIENVNIDGSSQTAFPSSIFSEANVRIGENTDIEGSSEGIEIETSTLSITNGGSISANTFRRGDSGLIKITATENVLIRGEGTNTRNPSNIFSQVGFTAIGNSRGIEINTGDLLITDGAQINSTTNGQGDAGAIKILATGNIQIDSGVSLLGSTGIFSGVNSTATGNSEGINIETTNLSVINGSFIDATTFGQGNAGAVEITATGQIILSGTFLTDPLDREIGGILAFTETIGTAGNITINTPQLKLLEGAGIEAFTQGSGNAGNIVIENANSVTLGENTNITVETSDAGKAGDIIITSDTITIGQDAQLSATATETATNTEGGGSINLNTQNLNISGELGIFAETQGQTPAGSLTINPNNNNPNLNIRFTDNGFISARTSSAGEGGDIAISAPQNLDIRGEGQITVETSGSGNAGAINIKGNTGEINLNSNETITLNNSNINSAVEEDARGNSQEITLTTPNLNLNNSEISAATAGQGNAGSITVENAENTNLNNSTISTAIAPEGVATQPSNITL